MIGLATSLMALAVGAVLGASAGYFGGIVDNVISRIMDVFMCVPPILLSLAVVAALGTNLRNLIIAITVSCIPGNVRLIRSVVLTTAEQDYVEAAKSYGTSNVRIIFRYVLPIALVCNPKLLIADEPTTALNVTIQAQILSMICDLQRRYGTSVIMITHDLGVVAETCDKVGIMYAGEIVECGTLVDIFTGKDHHPYTKGLFGSIPNLEENARRLSPIEGLMPDPTDLPKGCKFAPRCSHCSDLCKQVQPEVWKNRTHQIRCHRFSKDEMRAEKCDTGKENGR